MESLDRLRAAHGVRLVELAEEGVPFPNLPAGVYGFAHSPDKDSSPLYQKHTYQTFEVHKLPDGSRILVGYATPEDAPAFANGAADRELRLYPEPWGTAVELVSVEWERCEPSRRGPSRQDGNYLGLRLL